MPRHARLMSRTGIFHVMLRGINKQIIFEDDEDRERFIETIERYKPISKCQIYGYCIMSNHIHLLIKEMEEQIPTIIKRICSSYVFWYNSKYQRCGHLFQERYKSEIVENDEYLLTVLRYIHQNPVKAGLSESVQKYKWSSYNEYTGKPVITDITSVLQIFSADREKAIGIFIEHTKEQNHDKCLDYSEKLKLSDEEVRKHIEKLGLHTINELQQIEKNKRDAIIREIKAIKGTTIRQLSRVTGLSKSVIDRI